MLALMEGVIYSYEALSLVFVARESQRAESVLRGEDCNSVALPERLSSGVRKCDLCTSTLGHTRRQVSVRFWDDTRVHFPPLSPEGCCIFSSDAKVLKQMINAHNRTSLLIAAPGLVPLVESPYLASRIFNLSSSKVPRANSA